MFNRVLIVAEWTEIAFPYSPHVRLSFFGLVLVRQRNKGHAVWFQALHQTRRSRDIFKPSRTTMVKPIVTFTRKREKNCSNFFSQKYSSRLKKLNLLDFKRLDPRTGLFLLLSLRITTSGQMKPSRSCKKLEKSCPARFVWGFILAQPWFLCFADLFWPRMILMTNYLDFVLKRAFDVDLLYIATHFGHKLYEVDINWKECDGSKVTMASWVQMGLDLLSIRLHYMFGAWKLNRDLRIADWVQQNKTEKPQTK